MTLQWGVHRYLDERLRSPIRTWKVEPATSSFFGLPNEAEQGFQLEGADGAAGTLISRRPDMWVLRWKSPEATLCEEWAIALPDRGRTGNARASLNEPRLRVATGVAPG